LASSPERQNSSGTLASCACPKGRN
jgi:hypothetical protein